MNSPGNATAVRALHPATLEARPRAADRMAGTRAVGMPCNDPMRVLALDTTGPPASVAVWSDDHLLVEDAPDDARPLGVRLPGWITAVVSRAGLRLLDFDLFVVGAGPGSLTGLRVGIATMQGLAFSSGRPLAGVSALDALAARADLEGLVGGDDLVAAWRDARRGEVFAALYERSQAGRVIGIGGPAVGPAAELCRTWHPLVAGRRLVVVGDAAEASAPAWAQVDVVPACARAVGPLSGVMARLAAGRGAAGAGAPHAVHPLYVRRPDAEIARERSRAIAAPAGGTGGRAGV